MTSVSLERMIPLQVTCDVCQKKYELVMQLEKIGDIEKNYFKCPHCQTEYITACIDSSVRKKQLKVKKLNQQLRLLKGGQEIIKKVNQINDLEAEIKAEMAELKEKLNH